MAGAEVEIAPARNYQEVFSITAYLPFANIRNFAGLGKPEWSRMGEMSNKVVDDDNPRVKLGQSVTTSELYTVDRAMGNYLSLHEDRSS